MNIFYIVVGALVIVNIVIITIAIKCAHPLPDDFEFYDEDGDHVYYDRKLIKYKHKNK